MTTYSIDTAHSEVGFTVRHMVFAKVRGQFKAWTATVALDGDDFTKAKLHVEIDASSIDTREEKRDAHLKSADFFDVEKFPKLTFDGKRIEGSGGRYKVTGDLAMHGVTKEITLDVEQTGTGKDPWGNDRIGFSGKTKISRAAWGLTWTQALETGGLLVGDDVEIDVEVQIVKGK